MLSRSIYKIFNLSRWLNTLLLINGWLRLSFPIILVHLTIFSMRYWKIDIEHYITINILFQIKVPNIDRVIIYEIDIIFKTIFIYLWKNWGVAWRKLRQIIATTSYNYQQKIVEVVLLKIKVSQCQQFFYSRLSIGEYISNMQMYVCGLCRLSWKVIMRLPPEEHQLKKLEEIT